MKINQIKKLQMLAYLYKASRLLGSCSFSGEKAEASAENRSSGSVMFSRYFNSFISLGAMLLRPFFVVLYIWYIMSLTCKSQSNKNWSLTKHVFVINHIEMSKSN